MSQFIYGQPQLETRAELINIDTVDLDGPAKIHEDFFRSLRILRAMVGYMVFVCIVSVPIMIFWGFFDGYITAINNFSLYVVVAIFFLGIFFVIVLHTFFYALRGVAVGSLGVTRSVVAITWVALAAQVYNWGFYIFEFTRPAPVVPFNIVVFISFHLIAVYVLYLLLVGLIKAIRSRDKIFYPWLHDQKYSRNFWPGWVGLIRSFWLAMGIPVPPRQVKMVRRITFAALCAFALEGLAVTSYFQISDNLDNRYEKLQEAGDRRGNTQYREYKWFFIDLLHEIFVFSLMGPVFWWSMFALSRRLRRYARRRSLISADAAMLADPRNPILFLRSFSDDQISLSKAKLPWLLRFFDPGAVASTLDELLVSEYADVGPVIAIGRPSDALPPLGASRRYCQGTEWQEIVRSLMQASAVIVMGMGRSAGLAWEIATIRSMSLVTKTAFVFPPDSTNDRSMLDTLLIRLGFDLRTRRRFAEKIAQYQSDQAIISVSFPDSKARRSSCPLEFRSLNIKLPFARRKNVRSTKRPRIST